MTMVMGLMGAGISRSRMPRLQQFLGTQQGVNVNYCLIDGEGVDGFDPVARAQQCLAEGFSGINVTHPYKQRVWPLVSEPAVAGHEHIGSYNTLTFKDGVIRGANTDFSGFMRGYRFRRGKLAPGKVLMAGAGGVGRAIAFGLGELGATEIALYDIHLEQSSSLCATLNAAGYNARVVQQQDLADAITAADGLVNCTAIGMYSHPGNLFDPSVLGGQQWVFDAVYTPLDTEFIIAARTAGLQCISGFDLWIYQGLDAFKIFTGVDVEDSQDLISEALSWLD
ncbi:shikimate dehydrogenase [Halioxenophilus aromaticivorans]|uniref:Shikimate dehydrogenase n=2 Tax=Halioxenophilus aromaticivorans TaxID=1306992 RepID=A0AAV3U1Y1_9ALTE